jgi:hypothetical protein
MLKLMHQFNEDGIKLLRREGYKVGEYNPYNVRAWVINDEHGYLGVVIGEHEQDALDNAADNGILDRLLMSPEDYEEYSVNGYNDSYICLGNASKPFWSEYLGITECANTFDNNSPWETV